MGLAHGMRPWQPRADEHCFHFAFLFPSPFVLLHHLCLWPARSHHHATLLPSFSVSLLYPTALLLLLLLPLFSLLPTVNIFAFAAPDLQAAGRHFGEILRRVSLRGSGGILEEEIDFWVQFCDCTTLPC